jgi:TolB-like protein/DNA-binding winged helix-turn-helix (wHTH) protein/cytochrome c-type biogenesis protein CcmH/NrfG
MEETYKSAIHVGDQLVDPTRCTILRGEETIRVEPRVMDVLMLMISRAGHVITREEFINTVWGGTFVSDEVLSRCIYRLRQALGDNPKKPLFIETVPKRGYRLIAPVGKTGTEPELVSETTSMPEASSRAQQSVASSVHPYPSVRKRLFWVVFLVSVCLFMAFYIYREVGIQQQSDPVVAQDSNAIAVLPFANLSDSEDNDYIGEGISEELIGLLAKVPNLKVVARTSSFKFRDKGADVQQIAEILGVAKVVEGSVQIEENRIRVTARLVDPNTAYHLWSETYDTQFEDVFTVQEKIASAIVRALKVSLDTDNGMPNLTERDAPTTDMTAYRLYLQGLYHWKRRGEPSIRKSIGLFQKAIERDPAFAHPHQALSSAYLVLPFYSSESREYAFAQAETAARNALQLDPSMGKAHAVLAFISMKRWDWTTANRQFQLAITTSPNDPTTHQWYSEFLSYVGNIDASVTEALLALELDPVSPVINDRLGVTYLWSGEFDLAAEQFRIAAELGMDRVAIDQAYALLLLRSGQIEEAVRLYEKILGKLGFDTAWVRLVAEATRDTARASEALEAITLARSRQSIPDAMLFYAAVLLKQPDLAFDTVVRLIGNKSLTVEFLFAPEAAELRRDPRFPGVLSAVGLDDYWDKHGWPAAFCKSQHSTVICF